MALQFVRLRRTLTSISSLYRSISSPIFPTSPPLPKNPISPSPSVRYLAFSLFQLRPFTGSRVSFSSAEKKEYKVFQEGDELTDDMVIFEGCDYNHWLITMHFPKDPQPTPEEMVATYERTCAEGLGISIEEAKKKMYACSTTTYQGFQVVMTEEEAEKFKDLPGVMFVLPDSYIDETTKEYAGDKYENGIITPRPAPEIDTSNDGNDSQPGYDEHGNPLPEQYGYPDYSQYGYNGIGRYRTLESYAPKYEFEYMTQAEEDYQDFFQDQKEDKCEGSSDQEEQTGQEKKGSEQEDRKNMQGEQLNYAPMRQLRTN